jgi:hypothetical protein
MKILLSEFHPRTNLTALLVFSNKKILRIFKFRFLRVPPLKMENEMKMKILFSEFHHRTNLTAPLLSNLGSKNKTTTTTQNFEIYKFKGLVQIPNFEFNFEFFCLQNDESITRLTSLSDFF